MEIGKLCGIELYRTLSMPFKVCEKRCHCNNSSAEKLNILLVLLCSFVFGRRMAGWRNSSSFRETQRGFESQSWKKKRFPVSIFSHHFLRKSLKSHTQNGKVPVWDPVLLLSSLWPLGQFRDDRNVSITQMKLSSKLAQSWMTTN